MSKGQGPQALTANRLDDGVVVYWGADGWTPRLWEASLFDGEAAQAALAAALAQETAVVGPYLVPMAGPGSPDPRVKAREALRARGGPSAGATTREKG